jgi:N-acetyl-anhydromuramyl-L-alanine amidase AmpD
MTVVRILPDTLIAWHAGDCADPAYENPTSIGIEIAWTVGRGPLPQIARDTTAALVRELLTAYPSITKIETHRAQALPRGRKIDPSGWPNAEFYPWRDALLSPVPPPLATYHTRAGAVVRALPTTQSAIQRHLGAGTTVSGGWVTGQQVAGSNQWLRIPDGYIHQSGLDV